MTLDLPDDIVAHPLYGSKPMHSGVSLPNAVFARAHWSYGSERFFPESAIIADTTKQNYNVFPRYCYVDILKHCRGCDRPFIFFAMEQKHWFETLRFYVDADCVHCTECGKSRRRAKRRVTLHAHLAKKKDLSDEEFMHFVDNTVHLLQAGFLKNLSRLGQLKNRAMARMPEYSGTRQLEEALRCLRAGSS